MTENYLSSPTAPFPALLFADAADLEKSRFYTCCCKLVCNGCFYADAIKAVVKTIVHSIESRR
jgi:hypothetical protein